MPLDPSRTDRREEIDGRYVLHIERRFAHPVERVWESITRPERIKEWLAGVIEVLELELVEGGRYLVRWMPELADEIVGRSVDEPLVTEDVAVPVAPPRGLQHTVAGN